LKGKGSNRTSTTGQSQNSSRQYADVGMTDNQPTTSQQAAQPTTPTTNTPVSQQGTQPTTTTQASGTSVRGSGNTPDSYQVGYGSNLLIGDSYVNVSNTHGYLIGNIIDNEDRPVKYDSLIGDAVMRSDDNKDEKVEPNQDDTAANNENNVDVGDSLASEN